MGWRPNMSPEQRERFNVGRRRRYARKRIRLGLPYTPKIDESVEIDDPANLPTLTPDEVAAVLKRLEGEDDAK